jgi:hypothetical protein
MPDEIRRRQVLEAIAAGRLPSRLPTTSWAGYGSGAVCSVCRKLIDADQLETEFKDRGASGRTVYLHLQCLAAWESVTATAAHAAAPVLQGVADGGYSSACELQPDKGAER